MKEAGKGAICRCPGGEEAFLVGFQAGATFLLDLLVGREGELLHQVAWAIRLSQAVGEPLSVELVMGAVARAAERAEERVSLLLPSEARFRWRSLRREESGLGATGREDDTAASAAVAR
jgi:hypothetical protein